MDPSTGTLPAGTPTEEGLATLNITFKPTATGPRTTVMSIKTRRSVDWQRQPGRYGPADAEGKASGRHGLLRPRGHQAAPSGTLIGLLFADWHLLLRRRRTA